MDKEYRARLLVLSWAMGAREANDTEMAESLLDRLMELCAGNKDLAQEILQLASDAIQHYPNDKQFVEVH